MKKKIIKWVVGIVLCPIVLFLILFTLVYVPPVQRWLVDKASEIASEETGMNVNMESVSLSFPLSLAVDGLVVSRCGNDSLETDTIARVERIIVDVCFLSLIDGRVDVDAFEFQGVSMNSHDIVPVARVKGNIALFSLRSHGIDLANQIVRLDETLLSDANLEVWLNDTTETDTLMADTTEMALPWKIVTDNILAERIDIALHTPGDTMSVSAHVGQTALKGITADLIKGQYSLDAFTLNASKIAYDNNLMAPTEGLDYNHIALDNINIALDSAFYSASETRLLLRECAMREKSGLEIVNLAFPLTLDSTTLHIPELKLLTPASDIEALAHVALNVMDDKAPGECYLRLYASIGKDDAILFCGDMPQSFRKDYPTAPMVMRASVSGNMKHADIDKLSLTLPGALSISTRGEVRNITDLDAQKAHFFIEGSTENLTFIETMIDTTNKGSIRIPAITLEGTMNVEGQKYCADLVARQDSGIITLTAAYQSADDAYAMDVTASDINLHNFLPADSLYMFSAIASIEGQGFDAFSRNTQLNAKAKITELRYGSWNLNHVDAVARIKEGVAHARVESHNPLADGTVSIDALMSRERVDATLVSDVRKVDMFSLRMSEKPLTMGMCAHIDLKSDLNETHSLEGGMGDLTIITEKNTYRPEDIIMEAYTSPDTIWAQLESGDFDMRLTTSGGYMRLMEAADSMTAEMRRQAELRVIDQITLQHRLPVVSMQMTSGRNNPFANCLRLAGIDFNDMRMRLNTSPAEGITGDAHLYSLITDSMRIDTIRLVVEHDDQEYVRFRGEVANRRNNPHFVFKATADGYLFGEKMGIDMKYFDEDRKLGVQIGAHAEMQDSGIHVRFAPDKPILGYKEFNLNKDNFIFLARNKKLRAGIDLIADDGTGVKLYSTDEDNPEKLQDITVSLYKFDLEKLTSVMPYMPRLTGLMGGDFRLMQDTNEKLSMLSFLYVDNMTYEKNPMGNLSSEFAYLQRDDSTHVVDGTLSRNDFEIGTINGSYRAEGGGWLDAMLTLTRFPLSMANGFVPDGLLGLSGYGEGHLSVKGKVSKPIVNGELHLDSTHIISIPYGLNMRADDKPVSINNSKLKLDNYSIYGQNNNALSISGDIDFSNLDRLSIALRMRARDYQIINAKKQKGSIAYGKAYVNFLASVNGRLDDLRIRGRLDVLGKTDLTYILKDSPLTTDDRLKELVTFTDFRDTTAVHVKRPPIGGLNMQLTMNVENGTRVMCALNAAQTNYVSIEGGGELQMLYTPANDLQIVGRYTVNSGEMKYALPVIPLKTFKLQKGSYVEFTGDVMNPHLNLTATEQTKAQVSSADGSSRSVLFDCGVKISQTLNNLGLEFLLDAPEDMSIKNELASMGMDQRGKLAVTMLTTGMYLSDGNTEGFSMNNALSSFLQNEINSITNNAMRTVDISLGMDQNSDAVGNKHTDYSFKFAKRFWNNRVNLVIGGKISDGGNNSATAKEKDESFINNVSLEYRLDQTAQRNVRLFYNKDAGDLLEDEVTEYGAGFVWRKKMNNLSELFKSSKNTYRNMQRTGTSPYNTKRDTTIVGQSAFTTKQGIAPNTTQRDTLQNNKALKP